MKLNEVVLGQVYAVKVSRNVVPVRLERVHYHGSYQGSSYRGQQLMTERQGWVGTNLLTGDWVHVRSAAKLRFPLVPCATPLGWKRAPKPLAGVL